MTRFINGKAGQTATNPEVGDDIEVEITSFGGKVSTATGTIFKCEDCGGHYDVIAYANTDGKNLFTRAFRVDKPGGAAAEEGGEESREPDASETPDQPDSGNTVEPKKNGCGGARAESAAALAAFAFVGGLMLLKIKKY